MIKRGEYKKIKGISKDADNLIKSMLCVSTKNRITIEDILNHPWLKGVDVSYMGKAKVILFNEAEKKLFSQNLMDYKKLKKEEVNEDFTYKLLDTVNDTLMENAKTKSNLLAPFNSSYQGKTPYEALEILKEPIFFDIKAREQNRQYEFNNNGEVDNGVFINSDSLNRRGGQWWRLS